MNATDPRTTDEEIRQLTYFLRFFRPNELAFLVDVGCRWSRFDPDRIDKITSLVNKTFNIKQTTNVVQHALTFFARNTSLSFTHNFSTDELIGHQLSPFRSDCPVCESDLDATCASMKLVKMYCVKGQMVEASVFSVACKHIRTPYSDQPPIYVYPNFIRQAKSDIWNSVSLNSGNYVYLGGKHAFERALIEGYTCQLVGSPNSWNKVVDGWNLEAFNSGAEEKRTSWQLRLSHAFMKYKTIQFDLCIGSSQVSLPCAVRDFDKWLWETFPQRLTSFVYLWSNHKLLIGPCESNCSQCIIMDGHQKCRRRVCRAKQVEVKTEEFESLKIGCCRTPIRGSHYCEIHQSEHSTADAPSSSRYRRKKTMISWIEQRQKWQKEGNQGLGATNCRTSKSGSESYIKRCSRSFGVIVGVTNCKVIVTFSELFRSETLREIISLLCSTIRAADNFLPSTVVYDDGCHLAEFVQNHFGNDLAVTSASKLLKSTPFSIDRVHYKNHVGKWCRENMNPDNNRLLDGINTEAAEQLFSWLKRYASILSCLGWQRSPMFLLILFHNKNLERVNVRPTRVFTIIDKIPVVHNISLVHIVDQTLVIPPVNASDSSDESKTPNSFRNDYIQEETNAKAVHVDDTSGYISVPTTESPSQTETNNTLTNARKPEAAISLADNPWSVLASKIRAEATQKRQMRDKQILRNAKRWKQ